MIRIKVIYTALTISAIYLLTTNITFAIDNNTQLKLERAGRLLASSFVTGNPDDKLFGLHADYYPARPSEIIKKTKS